MQPTNQQQFIMKNKFNIALMGGRGYVGQEIIGILNNHPNFTLSKIFSKPEKQSIFRRKLMFEFEFCLDLSSI